ncbi:hypothetical protein LTR36_009070 [Oleoguttula mirabilis]|uniref:CHCH domain-containing protein n=1 Tax=Oleoguttula mirabilis TaxID=1507867 RepID=A0AAV9J6W4_9PEZI|nr:hypothetical protein LTR36_009070 [Oleoguttula mirabilis]
MPRQSRGSTSAPRRPTAPPAAPQRSAPQQPPQARQASTVARPAQTQQAPPPAAAQQSSGGSGLFGQMASTAAGVAVGSSIGHVVGGWFGGGSGSSSDSAVATAEPSQPVAQDQDGNYTLNQSYQAPKVCETDVNQFRKCMDENQGSLTICGWYLDQLKACQGAARQY